MNDELRIILLQGYLKGKQFQDLSEIGQRFTGYAKNFLPKWVLTKIIMIIFMFF